MHYDPPYYHFSLKMYNEEKPGIHAISLGMACLPYVPNMVRLCLYMLFLSGIAYIVIVLPLFRHDFIFIKNWYNEEKPGRHAILLACFYFENDFSWISQTYQPLIQIDKGLSLRFEENRRCHFLVIGGVFYAIFWFLRHGRTYRCG